MNIEFGPCRECRKRTAISVNTQTERGLLCVACKMADDDPVGIHQRRTGAALLLGERQSAKEPRVARRIKDDSSSRIRAGVKHD